jgi:dynein heavy chain
LNLLKLIDDDEPLFITLLGDLFTGVDLNMNKLDIQRRNDIPDILNRHFMVFNYVMPDAASIERIYLTIIEGHFIPERRFSGAVIETAKTIVPTTRDVWIHEKAKILLNPTKFYKAFNLRDLSRIV